MQSNRPQGELTGIQYPGKGDVLCGRGGHTVGHPGNVLLRLLVDRYKSRYLQASKAGRVQIASELVSVWRSQTPPGRFLIRTDPTKGDDSLWHDIGDEAARKKILNSLRQQIPTNDFLAAIQKQDKASKDGTSSALKTEASHSWKEGGPALVQYLPHAKAREQDTSSAQEQESHFIPWQASQHHYHHQQQLMLQQHLDSSHQSLEDHYAKKRDVHPSSLQPAGWATSATQAGQQQQQQQLPGLQLSQQFIQTHQHLDCQKQQGQQQQHTQQGQRQDHQEQQYLEQHVQQFQEQQEHNEDNQKQSPSINSTYTVSLSGGSSINSGNTQDEKKRHEDGHRGSSLPTAATLARNVFDSGSSDDNGASDCDDVSRQQQLR